MPANHRTRIPRQRLHIDEHPHTTLRLDRLAEPKIRVCRQLHAHHLAGGVLELDEPPARRNHRPTLQGPRAQ